MSKFNGFPHRCCGINLEDEKQGLLHIFMWHNPDDKSYEELEKELHVD